MFNQFCWLILIYEKIIKKIVYFLMKSSYNKIFIEYSSLPFENLESNWICILIIIYVHVLDDICSNYTKILIKFIFY